MSCPRVTVGAVVAVACVAAMPVRAQADSDPSGSPKLEDVVITADRTGSFSADLVQAASFRGARQLDTPLTVNVIPDALIQSQQAQSLLDALRNTAGVSPSQATPTVYNNLAIRGISVENRTNYRLNGILPVINLIDTPLEDKDRVEALKGASALYYGFTTPAGIANLTMKRPTVDPYLAATLFGNEYGALAGHVDASDTWGSLGARVNAVYGSVDSGIDNTRGHRSLVAGAFDYKPNDNLVLTLDAEHIRKRVNEPGTFHYLRLPASTPTNLYPALQLPPLLDPTINFGPGWAWTRAEERNVLGVMNWRTSPAWALSVSYGNSHIVRDRHPNSIDLDTYGPNTNGDGVLSIGLQPGATTDNSNYRGEIAGAVHLGFTKHQLLLGASQNIRDAFTSSSIPATCAGVPCTQNVFDPIEIPETSLPTPVGTRTRVNDIGYYLFDRIDMTHWLQLLAGIRKVDYTESSLDTGQIAFHATPTATSYGVVVKALPWMSLYGTYIQGLESTPPAPFAASNARQMLPATHSTQREAGIKIEPQRGLLIQAAYFDIERGSAFVNAANLYVLDGRARFRGAELSVTGEITRDWSLYATAQLLSAKQISGADTVITTNAQTGAVTVVPTVVGRKIENTPERTFSIATEYRLSNTLPGFSVSGAAYYLSERAVNQFDQAFIPGYTLFDVGAAYSGLLGGRETTLRVNAQNVTNKKYFASTGAAFIAPGPPRMIKFSVTTKF